MNIFVWKWSKIAAQKKVFFADFALVHPPMASVLLSAWSRDALSPVCGIFFLKLFSDIFKASALWANAFYKLKCPSFCGWVCLSVRLFTFEVPFNGLFAPTFRNRLSNIFRDSESLGKSNGKKGSNI